MSRSDHEVHELPLATRLIEHEVREWLSTRLSVAAATFGDATEAERSARKAIDQVRHLHLSGAEYTLVPRIIGALRRAGLLVERSPDA